MERTVERFLDTVPLAKRKAAHDQQLQRDKLNGGLRKAEGSPAIQIRTGKVGFVVFLHARRVPDVVSPACQCGWRRQDPNHVIMFCPDHARNRWKLYEAAGTDRYLEILSTRKGLRALARLGMNEKLLSQFSLAKEQTDREEGRTNNEGESDEEEVPEQEQGEQSLIPDCARHKMQSSQKVAVGRGTRSSISRTEA